LSSIQKDRILFVFSAVLLFEDNSLIAKYLVKQFCWYTAEIVSEFDIFFGPDQDTAVEIVYI